jgi:hypothetical protein
LNHTARLSIPILPKELRKTHFGASLHRRMNEKLNAMVCPHSPLPLSHLRNQDQLEIDPVRVDTIVNALVGLDPIAIDVTGIRLLRTEAAVDVDLLDAGCPKGFDGGVEPLLQPLTPRCETKVLCDLLQRRLMISRWLRASARVEDWNQAASIILEIIIDVNTYAVILYRQPISS